MPALGLLFWNKLTTPKCLSNNYYSISNKNLDKDTSICPNNFSSQLLKTIIKSNWVIFPVTIYTVYLTLSSLNPSMPVYKQEVSPELERCVWWLLIKYLACSAFYCLNFKTLNDTQRSLKNKLDVFSFILVSILYLHTIVTSP